MNRRPSILPILGVNFVGTLGFSIVIPFLIFLVTRWGGNAVVYGVIGATYSVFQLIGAPLLGRWSDTIGRRRVLLFSHLGTLLSWAIFAVAFALPERTLLEVDSRALGSFALTLPLVAVFVARALDGLTGGNISVANAYLVDITTEEERSASFGKMSMTGNIGFILGPALAGILGATVLGELLPVLAAMGVSILAALLIIFLLPESRPCLIAPDPRTGGVSGVFGQEQRDCFEPRDKPSLRTLMGLPGVFFLLTMNFLIWLGFNFFYIAFPVFAATSLGWSVGDVGLFLAVSSLLMALVQGPVLGRVSRVFSDRALVLAGSLILSASFLFFPAGKVLLLYGGAVLMALGNGLMWPSVASLLSKTAGNEHQGSVQGLAGSAGAVASILGLVVGGFFYGEIGANTFVLASLVIFAVFLMALRVRASD